MTFTAMQAHMHALKKKSRQLAGLLLLLALLPLLLGFQVPANPGEDFAFDSTGTLSAANRQTIRQVNEQIAGTGAQVVVCMIASLDGESIEDAALQIFRSWGIGSARENNGILLLVAKEDQKLRIEVGYGLEGAIPDSVADRIIRNVIAPHFREGDFDTGILEGFNAIVTLVAEEYDLEITAEGYAPVDSEDSDTMSAFETFLAAVIMIMFLAIYLGRFTRFIRPGRRGGPPRTGGWTGGGGWSSGGHSSGGGGFGGGSSGGGGASGGW